MAEASRYIEAVGRRKTSTARVRITEASKNTVIINDDKEVNVYFKTPRQQHVAVEALTATPIKFKVTVHVKGGGLQSQAEAVRHGISRALLVVDKELRPGLKKQGFLKRDPRAKERRKFGLKKARKAPQWSKR